MSESSAITFEQAAHLADLARISLSDEELGTMANDLSTILGNVARVSEVATAEVPETSHPIPLENVMRKDVVGDTLSNEQALAGAPAAEDGKFLVPQILGEE